VGAWPGMNKLPKTTWHEDDGFWTGFAPVMFDHKRWAAAGEEADSVVRLLGLGPGARLLDACCGTGRHSLELARRGLHVTGLDRTAEFLEAARASAVDFGLGPDFVLADARNFRLPDSFDAVINMGTSIGYFEDVEDDRSFLRGCFDALRPGGRILIDTWGKEIIIRDFREDEWYEQDGCLVCAAYRLLGDCERLENRWLLVQDGRSSTRTFSFRMFSAVELRAELVLAGFTRTRVYGGFDGRPYDRKAERLIAVAERPLT
jgi:SAM-dependent methyltransferase